MRRQSSPVHKPKTFQVCSSMYTRIRIPELRVIADAEDATTHQTRILLNYSKFFIKCISMEPRQQYNFYVEAETDYISGV